MKCKMNDAKENKKLIKNKNFNFISIYQFYWKVITGKEHLLQKWLLNKINRNYLSKFNFPD